ncbi:MAG: hypothetical protein EOO08_14145 [Chitinophagaceae bacterium]|nr:MAG: hypothetical protein EOO08_14145 [Chitinophagaceae bacterium]
MKRFWIFFLLAALSACAGPGRISSAWVKPGNIAFTPTRVIVFCVVPLADSSLRVPMEQHLADDLRTMGFPAQPGSVKYASVHLAAMSRDSAYSVLRSDSVDAVVTIVLKAAGREVLPVEQRSAQYQQWQFPGYYHKVESEAAIPETVTFMHRYWESNTYNLLTRELLATLQTESFDAGSAAQSAHEYGKLVSTHLQAAGVFRR